MKYTSKVRTKLTILTKVLCTCENAAVVNFIRSAVFQSPVLKKIGTNLLPDIQNTNKNQLKLLCIIDLYVQVTTHSAPVRFFSARIVSSPEDPGRQRS